MELRTPRLRLRPYRAADFDLLFEQLVLDPAVTGLWADYANPSLTLADRRAMAEDDLGAWITEAIAAGLPTWVIEAADPGLGSPGDFLGSAGVFPPQNPWGPEPEVGCLVVSRHHGRGIATEALDAIMDDARARIGIDVVAAIVDEENAASLRLVEKLGFELERSFLDEDGRPCRRYVRRSSPSSASQP